MRGDAASCIGEYVPASNGEEGERRERGRASRRWPTRPAPSRGCIPASQRGLTTVAGPADEGLRGGRLTILSTDRVCKHPAKLPAETNTNLKPWLPWLSVPMGHANPTEMPPPESAALGITRAADLRGWLRSKDTHSGVRGAERHLRRRGDAHSREAACRFFNFGCSRLASHRRPPTTLRPLPAESTESLRRQAWVRHAGRVPGARVAAVGSPRSHINREGYLIGDGRTALGTVGSERGGGISQTRGFN